MFRAVHSIKGGAGAFGLDDLVALRPRLRDHSRLRSIRQARAEPGRPEGDAARGRRAGRPDAAARDGGSVDDGRSRGLVKELEALANGECRLARRQPRRLRRRPPQRRSGRSGADAQADGRQRLPAGPLFLRRFRRRGDAGGLPTYEVIFKPRSELYAKANEAALLLRELAAPGRNDDRLRHTDDLPRLDELDPEGAYLAWNVTIKTDEGEDAIREVFEFVEWDCELDDQAGRRRKGRRDQRRRTADVPVPFDLSILDDSRRNRRGSAADARAEERPQPLPPPRRVQRHADCRRPRREEGIGSRRRGRSKAAAQNNAAGAGQTIRVDLDRVDRLINLVGELVINQAMLSQRVIENEHRRHLRRSPWASTSCEQLTREIQDSVMAIRAQPVKSVFQRMPRLVREVADMTGKPVRLVTEGENTEVDKTVIERLADPLTHMIRNAIDHGLETPEKRARRRQAGRGHGRA